MNLTYRVAVVDDHLVVRDLIKFQLGRVEPRRFEVVGEGATGHDAVEVCLKTRPDIVLLDLMLPGLNGCEVMKRVMPHLPNLRVLLFTGSMRAPLITEALQLGAAGFVGKLRPWQTVIEAINLVSQGGKYFDPAVAHLAGNAPGQANWQTLTAREREVIQLIAEGRSSKEIASKLGVSAKPSTNTARA